MAFGSRIESANFIQAKTTSILKNSKPSRQRNMTRNELETLKWLSKGSSVTILPADKVHAVTTNKKFTACYKIRTLTQRFQIDTGIPLLAP